MNLFKRIAKKLARRVRAKGKLSVKINQPGRKTRGITAQDLWARSYSYKTPAAKREGTKRRIAREKHERKYGPGPVSQKGGAS